jgi:hypothetical protein
VKELVVLRSIACKEVAGFHFYYRWGRCIIVVDAQGRVLHNSTAVVLCGLRPL